jgi:hypothetical protein
MSNVQKGDALHAAASFLNHAYETTCEYVQAFAVDTA